MNIVENIKEGIRSIKANMLRSVITAFIVALGIMALVGMLTTVDVIEESVNESLSTLGSNTFEIRSKRNRGNRGGVEQKRYPKIKFHEARRFISLYDPSLSASLSATVTWTAEVKHMSKKTNPNVRVVGVNEEYMGVKLLELEKGRNFSTIEIDRGSHVVVLGAKVASALYDDKEDPIGSTVTFLGTQFRVIGVLVEKGQLSEDNYDNMAFIPVIVANQMAQGNALNYTITVAVPSPDRLEYAMGEATGMMRNIRRDRIREENSFDIEKSETLAESLQSITAGFRWGGVGVGFVTLLGASIALMNIMLVSVTERTREVGLRKAIGATPLRIRQQFIIEAIVVCLLGGIAGIILGLLIGNLLARLLGADNIEIPWVWIFVGFSVCIVVGLISGYYPAHKASKLDPIESLRFE